MRPASHAGGPSDSSSDTNTTPTDPNVVTQASAVSGLFAVAAGTASSSITDGVVVPSSTSTSR